MWRGHGPRARHTPREAATARRIAPSRRDAPPSPRRATAARLGQAKTASSSPSIDRKAFDDTLIKKMFVVPSFEIHNGVAGLFDLGPTGCALKGNLIDT